MQSPRLDRATASFGHIGHFIGGAWVSPNSAEVLTMTSPSTGASIGTAAAADSTDVERALRAAIEAEQVLADMSVSDRAAMCYRVSDAIQRHQEDLAFALALDQGKPLKAEAETEASVCSLFYRHAAEDVQRLYGETIPTASARKRVLTTYRSRGAYAVITPWNFPYNIASEYLSICLAAGNPVVWLPSPMSTGCSAVLANAIAEADLPPGAINFITGMGAQAGDQLVADDRVRGVCFTGSSAVGRTISSRAGLKPLLLELGGNGPILVLDDADLELAASGIAFSAFYNAGQACSASERIIVHERIVDDLLGVLEKHVAAVRLGDPFEPTTTMGPLNNEAVAAKMDRHIADAVESGARVIAGGRRSAVGETDLYFEPTVLLDVRPGMEVFQEESFGPVIPITPCADVEEGIRLANANAFGLIASVYTQSLHRAFAIGERVRAGIVNVNETPDYWDAITPYGGASGTESGLGRLGGAHGLREVMDLRGLVIDIGEGTS